MADIDEVRCIGVKPFYLAAFNGITCNFTDCGMTFRPSKDIIVDRVICIGTQAILCNERGEYVLAEGVDPEDVKELIEIAVVTAKINGVMTEGDNDG